MEYNYTTSQVPDKWVRIGPEPIPTPNAILAMAQGIGVQVGPEPTPTPDAILAMTQDSNPGFAGNFIEVGITVNENKNAVYTSKAYPANSDGKQRPGAVIEYSSEFSVGDGIGAYTEVLPDGYLAAKFLESTGTQYIDTGLKGISQNSFVFFEGVLTGSVDANGSRAFHAPGWTIMAASGGGRIYCNTPNTNLTSFFSGYYNFEFSIPFKIKTISTPGEIIFNGKKITYAQLESGKPSEALSFTPTLKLCAYSDVMNYVASRWRGRIERFHARLDGEIDFLPALFNGIPCMFDKVSKQPFRNSGTGAFIVGLTLTQARKLGKHLPEGGGTLTVSLPSNWQEDEGVLNARAEAEAKGWQIPVQTYEAEASAATTFSLRRIWVRKTPNEHGSYIDIDGSRWSVDWCVDVWGADPQELGYEPYRSVEAAVEYWGLTPWIDPEQEEEFSQEL